jgi:hypothetical protein
MYAQTAKPVNTNTVDEFPGRVFHRVDNLALSAGHTENREFSLRPETN